jgi:hypothetical protein
VAECERDRGGIAAPPPRCLILGDTAAVSCRVSCHSSGGMPQLRCLVLGAAASGLFSEWWVVAFGCGRLGLAGCGDRLGFADVL